MKTKKVGEVESLNGKLDEVPYHIFTLKETDYNMKMMSTYGTGMEDYTFRKNKRTYKKRRWFLGHSFFLLHFCSAAIGSKTTSVF